MVALIACAWLWRDTRVQVAVIYALFICYAATYIPEQPQRLATVALIAGLQPSTSAPSQGGKSGVNLAAAEAFIDAFYSFDSKCRYGHRRPHPKSSEAASLPLTGNSRYGALAALAEQQLHALQLAMSTASGSSS